MSSPSRDSDSESSAPEESQKIDLKNIPTYASLAKLIGFNTGNDHDSNSHSEHFSTGSSSSFHQSSSCVSLSFSALMRAEASLNKKLPVVHGGMHVEFTKEDLMRIKDPEVLEFFEKNGGLFKKYLKSKSSPVAPSKETPSSVSAADIQKKILEFQNEIETFITAVDDVGRTYKIEIDESGVVQVPIDDDTGLGEEFDSEEIDTLRSDHEEIVSTTEITPVKTGVADGEGGASDHEEVAPPRPPTPSLDEVGRKTSDQEVVQQTDKTEYQMLIPSSRARKLKSKPQKTSKVATSKPLHAARPDEDERVELLLQQSKEELLGCNPFYLSSDISCRVSKIDEELKVFQSARKSLPSPEVRHEISVSAAPFVTGNDRASTKALGDYYLHELKEAKKLERALHRSDAALLATREEFKQLERLSMDKIPDDILKMRPKWLSDHVALVSDAELHDALEEALEEDRKAMALNLVASERTEDPYSSLLDSVRSALARSEALTKEVESSPLELTPFDPEISFSDSFELGEVPENIRDDIFTLI